MSCVSFRAALEGEAAALADIRLAAMRPSLEAVGRFDAARARDRFLSTFRAEDTLVIQHDGQVAGVLVLREDDDPFLLDHLYISPAFQALGLGRAALHVVFERADARGRVVRVGALKGSRSNEFYLRHGFKLVEQGEWDNYYARGPGGA